MKEYKLSELFDLQMGKTPSRNDQRYWKNGNNKWISIGDLTNTDKYIYDTKEYISNEAICETGIKEIPPNTIVMSFKLSIGKVAVTSGTMFSNEAIMAFLDKGIENIETDYLYYLFLHEDWNKGTNKAVMGKTLNKKTLSDVKIKIHDRKNQKKIIEVLDNISEILRKKQKQLDLLDKLVKSRFVEMFGDPVINDKKLQKVSLSYLSNLKSGKAISTGELSDVKHENSYPCYGGNGLRGYINRFSHDGSYSLIGRQGALSGNVNFVSGKFYATEHAIVVTPIRKLNDVWYYYVLKYLELQRFQTGAAQPGLSVKKLNTIEIPLPPLELQNEFADFVKEVDKLKYSILS